MEEDWKPDEDLEKFAQELSNKEDKKFLRAVALPFVIFLATCFMSEAFGTTADFFTICLLALACRLIFTKLLDYSHITCTIIGIASVIISYALVWFGWQELDNCRNYAPFWMRLIWGLLL